MFWRLGFGHTSPLETLLDSDNYTLQQLLDEDDLIQECKQLNKKLIDFLALPEQVEALIDYVVRDAPADGDEKSKFVYPYKASEVLSADLSGVVDCVFQSEALLDKLFNFLNKDPPLNPLLAVNKFICFNGVDNSRRRVISEKSFPCFCREDLNRRFKYFTIETLSPFF
mmetsp:Transcript_67686/g.180955  ORF Transcript_67686/g.180955 Transcript_67686/m.180955 type:complete len:169 (+) Transcript_67686:329-835(+)